MHARVCARVRLCSRNCAQFRMYFNWIAISSLITKYVFHYPYKNATVQNHIYVCLHRECESVYVCV